MSTPLYPSPSPSPPGSIQRATQQEQCRSRRILRAERLSYRWKLANSAMTAPKTFLQILNRNKRLKARVLRPRHSSGSLINSDQEMAGLLNTTFLDLFREDEGSTPIYKPRTQPCMANPLTTEPEVRRALDCHNPHKDHVPHDVVRKRIRGALIFICKIMHFPCDAIFAAPTGHTFKIHQRRCKTR